jgi:hypothetical protein
MNKETKDSLKKLLNIISDLNNWQKIEKNNNSWGDCLVHYDDFLSLDKGWIERAKKIKKEI